MVQSVTRRLSADRLPARRSAREDVVPSDAHRVISAHLHV
ncbi:MAG: hypothetical protein AVDCRST_MAG64-3069 [uncultured Phycisphaerae bacterium]|uniref:Uncharacterized protein n=1 Tax=uncultured Phycisphaerae bacterium TaxID=904963 RepID=A0A6J4PL17_9BACT|nr:MAG: hypothetical protein AVDCRST_MAG64-3069 [uncultured Phycisphaerae bacterium]